MSKNNLALLVVIETAMLGLVAMTMFGVLMDQYEKAQHAIAERTAIARATEVFIALLTATPPTATPTASSTATPTFTATATSTPVPTRTATPLDTATPSRTPTPSISPTPSRSPTPTLSPTPRPTRTPTTVPSNAIARCETIDNPGTYHLSADLVANGECIVIKSSYVILDCAGHSIRGTNYTGYGIAIRKYGLLNAQTPAYVEVRNCRLSKFFYGIFVEAGTKLVIQGNDSSNNFDDVDPVTRYGKFLGMTDGGGIRLNHTTDSQVLANKTLNQAIGIDVRYSSGIVVRNNIASNNSAWGINILRTTGSEVASNTTVDNVRKCTWGAGVVGFGCDAGGIVLQDGSSGNVVANNSVTGRNGNGIFIKAHAMPCGNNNSILGNTITGALYNAVELSFCSGNRINNNQMRDSLDGIWLGFANNTEIKGNVIANMRNHGIISANSRHNTVSGNHIINSNEAIYFYSEEYDRREFSFLPPGDYTSHSNCLCGNTLQNNTIAIRLFDSTHNQVTGNTYINNGRNVLAQGRSDGNNIQGYAPFAPYVSLAMRLPRALRPIDCTIQ